MMSTKLFLTITLLQIGFCGFSQNLGECATSDTSFVPKSSDCSTASDTWFDEYRMPEYWKANSSTPLKTIKVNIVVCRDDNGNNGWQDIPYFHDQLDLMFSTINDYFSNIPYKGYDLTCDPMPVHIQDSKIRFELNEVYFIDNSYFNSRTFWGTAPIADYIHNVYPETKNALCHIFTQPQIDANGWGRYTVQNGEAMVHTESSMFSDGYVVWEDHIQHFTHEYGHAVGIHHTYGSEQRTIDHYNFLDDIFGTCAEPMLSDPNHECFDSSCNPQPDQICYLKECFWDQFAGPYPLMSGKNNNRYISPKMTGRFHRALSIYDETHSPYLPNQPMHRYVKEKYPYSLAKEINQDETWDFGIKMYQDIIVKSGNTLTVTCEVKMPVDGSIIIEPGAMLVVDGGTITSAHDEMWQGIQVHGDTYAAQNSVNCGILRTKNGATITNAREAIRIWDNANEDWATLGGILQCSETNFINNKRNCAFLAYNLIGNHSQDYKAYFNRCHFEFNDDHLLSQEEVSAHNAVTLWGVKGVKFRGCTFENKMDVTGSVHRKNAIYSIDASYYVIPFCDALVAYGNPCPTEDFYLSNFKGYHRGVEASGAYSSLSASTIKGSLFDENMVGVYLDVADHCQIIDNSFNVGNHPYDAPFAQLDQAAFHTGVLTYALTDFAIEDNDFHGINTQSNFSHGVVVQEGQGAIVAVYNNNMFDLGSGAIGVGVNDDHLNVKNGGQYGLRFICNENSGNENDIEVYGPFSGQQGFVDDTQTGWDNVGQASGNTFSIPDGFNSNYVHLDFHSDKYYEYRYNDQNTDEIPNADEINATPTNSNALILPLTATSLNGCASNYVHGGAPDKYEYYSLKSAYYNLLYTYHQFIDQGNTEATLNDVAMTWPNDAWLLKEELVQRSPNNSDTVLIAAADRNILPHGMLLEVLLLNPDALRNGDVINHVKCCIADPMPDYMIDILLASRNVQTARTLVEQNLSNLRHKMALKHRLVVSDLLRDSLGTSNDTLVEWLGDMRHLSVRYQLVSHHLGSNNFSFAKSVMDSIEIQLRPKNRALLELNGMRQFVSILESYHSKGKNIAQLDSSEIDQLINLANAPNAGTAAARAENILCFFYDICSPPPSAPKSASYGSPSKPKPSAEEMIRDHYRVKFSPNPADDYIQLEYELLFAKENTILKVYDQLGRTVKTIVIGGNTLGVEILDTRKLMSGLYIIEILQNDKQVMSDKFIVQH